MIPPVVRVERLAVTPSGATAGERAIPEETPVAIVHNGSTYAVMMATPADLEDFGYGFSLTEGVIGALSDVEQIETLEFDEESGAVGVEIRLWLTDERAGAQVARRRQIAGPTGCGLCGVESLELAVKPAKSVPAGRRFTAAEISRAVASLPPAQRLNHETRAVHAAAFWDPAAGPDGELVALREDVGRHNALDKLVGHLVRSGRDASQGIVLLTSRVSIEMVQKTAMLGAGVLVAVSAPTALAVRTADKAGLTLAAIARDDGFEVFTHPHRIELGGAEQELVAHVG
ncbi:formate dehydrogenase accessory sulfurtransferase FdhD [Ancylobacter sp. TS-1]|uniref:formate dehydrogenase accessory sulfurtransferase FdhD n=1 Tax=Ancylobacter sp. TS-1 TaxID=1850374 RepID=UPI001265C985|nr:formate dehydrogenase accessory sulfurtransferase FdhD [Ancylobacter sp. TS-1]QFR33965.1 formate dehydrogenase accessory sulfurtransferase FdhD [Ancylobacter sp. TS-1]